MQSPSRPPQPWSVAMSLLSFLFCCLRPRSLASSVRFLFTLRGSHLISSSRINQMRIRDSSLHLTMSRASLAFALIFLTWTFLLSKPCRPACHYRPAAHERAPGRDSPRQRGVSFTCPCTSINYDYVHFPFPKQNGQCQCPLTVQPKQ